MKLRVMGIGALAFMTSLTLAACNVGGGAESTDGGDDALKPLKVAVAPIHYEAAYIAQKEGYFEEEGLDVEIIPGGSPTSTIARAVSGEADIVATSWGTVITSTAQGIPVKAIAGLGYVSPEHPTRGEIVMKDSPLASFKELEGASMAIVGLNGGSEISLFLAAEDQGIDPKSINLVEMPTSGMETALVQGTVDAISASSPFYEQILSRDDVRVLANAQSEYTAYSPITTWAATESWLASNPETGAAFVEAMKKAQTYYEDPSNVDRVLDISAEVSQVSRDSLSAETLAPLSVAINTKAAKSMMDDFARYGIVKQSKGLDEVLWSEAPRN